MKEKNVVVEGEFTPVEPERPEPSLELTEEAPRCELVIGMDATGGVYFNVKGTEQSIITMEGLLIYAEKEMNNLWARHNR